jgi:hypothetical protein
MLIVVCVEQPTLKRNLENFDTQVQDSIQIIWGYIYILLADTKSLIRGPCFEAKGCDGAVPLYGLTTQLVYRASAAANTPAAPPTRAMAPVGRGLPGAKPVLGVGAAEPDAPEPDALEPDALEPDALGLAPELSGV